MNRVISNSTGLAEIPSLVALSRCTTAITRAEFKSPRYLCISNGYEIFCLDLTEAKDQSFSSVEDIPLLPKIGTIDLLQNGLPTSVGLFNLGSHVYMIGGQNFPVSIVEEPDCFEKDPDWLDEDPQGTCDGQEQQQNFPLSIVQEPDFSSCFDEDLPPGTCYGQACYGQEEEEDKDEEEKRPSLLSKGFSHLGSDLYRIDVKPHDEFPHLADFWGRDPKGINLYRSLCVKCKVEASSRDIYALSLVEGTLSLFESNFVQPEKPKLWPIVETIDGQTHVIDSAPPQLSMLRLCTTGWISSHEVLSRDHDSWSEFPTIEDMGYIRSHLVVGHCLYAVSSKKCLVFDSEAECWDAPYDRIGHVDPFSVTTVWHILDLGIGRCVGGLAYGEPENPLYVLIALMQDRSNENFEVLRALAYVVTSTGLVVCFQHLPYFFEGPVKPFNIEGGTMIDVDEEGKTMCSIISGSGDVFPYTDCVFINTFTTAKGLTKANSKVLEVWEKGARAWPVEQDFVHVEFKDRYIYESDDGAGSIGMLGVRACFLPVCSREE